MIALSSTPEFAIGKDRYSYTNQPELGHVHAMEQMSHLLMRKQHCANWISLTVTLSALLLWAPSSEAVVLVGGDGSGNTTAPLDDPGFNNVGNRGVYLGNYSGNHWVITAAHVGAGTINFGGISYGLVAGSETRIKNPIGSGLSEFTDLTLFKIDSDPSLPNLDISLTVPNLGSTVTLIGDGLDRASSQTSWTVDGGTTPSTWTEGGASPNASGFKSLGTSTKRWGTNVITDQGSDTVIDAGFGDSRAIELSYDLAGGADEATLATGDSGGALFYKNGSNWELAGILQAIATFSGQPSNTSVFGNLAYAGDLSFYRDEILSVTAVPEPIFSTLALSIGALLIVRLHRRNPGTQ